jgi:hypothetical protein
VNYCNKCGELAETKMAVIDNVFYSNVCTPCLEGNIQIPRDAKYKRDRDREEFAKEILQPFDENNNINPDFAQAYQKESEKMFGVDRLQNI